jgi:hypothetical protein
MIRQIGGAEPRCVVLTEVTDPQEVARSLAVHEQARRNRAWLESHWAELLPGARGKFLAVAGQEAFIADTPKEANALARAAHPEDQGMLTQYVPAAKGPRIYANRWSVAGV